MLSEVQLECALVRDAGVLPDEATLARRRSARQMTAGGTRGPLRFRAGQPV
jgi:hypothetical protein